MKQPVLHYYALLSYFIMSSFFSVLSKGLCSFSAIF